jgi:hypothetical protein
MPCHSVRQLQESLVTSFVTTLKPLFGGEYELVKLRSRLARSYNNSRVGMLLTEMSAREFVFLCMLR